MERRKLAINTRETIMSIQNVPITDEEIARLSTDDTAVSGWGIDYLANENKELKTELAKLKGMTPSQLDAEAEKKAQSIAAEVSIKVKKKLDAPSFHNAEAMVEMELLQLEAREEAKRRYKTKNVEADLSQFDGTLSLTEALKADYELPEWRVKGMLRVGHITTVAGMAKAGKTSFLVNRVRALVDHQKLFGEYEVGQELRGNVGVWNFELTPGQMIDWFKKSGIHNTDKVRLVNARGAGLFIQDRIVVEAAIEWINRNEIEVLEIDPLQAAFVGSIISDEDAADFITALQRIQKESCVSDIILTTHMGHAAANNQEAQRSIGSARWTGFADNLIIFTREDGKPAKLRIDRGRDVQLDEISLEMDPETKILTKVFVPKPVDENWNAMLRTLNDGLVHKKDDVKSANGKDTKSRAAVNAHLKWLAEYGLVEEFDMKKTEKDGTEYSIDGKHGQKVAFVKLSEWACKNLHQENEEQAIPDQLWFEGHGMFLKVDKGE
jgi:hypothetical protein